MVKRYSPSVFSAFIYVSLFSSLYCDSLHAMEGKDEDLVGPPTPCSKQANTSLPPINDGSFDNTIRFNFSQNPSYAKGQEIIPILKSLSLHQTSSGTRYEQINAKRHNKKLKEHNTLTTREFSELLKSKEISDEKIDKFSALLYGHQKLTTNYLNSMITNLKEEYNAYRENRTPKDGYASNFINPKNKQARQRFVKDAVVIFNIRQTTSQQTENQYARLSLKDFHSFIKAYLSLVRDTSGSLFAREQALNLTKTALPEDQGLTNADCNARQKVFSAHYLGDLERTLEVLEILRPLAEIASHVQEGHKYFNLSQLDNHLIYARTELDRLSSENNDRASKELAPSISIDLPPKPLTRNQKRRLKLRQQNQLNIEHIKSEQTEQAKKEASVAQTGPFSSPTKPVLPIRMHQSETFESWFYKTDGKIVNVKNDFRHPALSDIKKTKKAEAKKLKKTATFSPPVEEEKVQKIKPASVQENIKTVVHTPHKKRSKRLRPYHVTEIQNILVKGDYTLKTVGKNGDQSQGKSIEIGGGPWKVFYAIHNNSYSGKMKKVTNMIQSLGGFVDETRSGSRIGIALRHLKTNEVVGADLLSLEETPEENIEAPSLRVD